MTTWKDRGKVYGTKRQQHLYLTIWGYNTYFPLPTSSHNYPAKVKICHHALVTVGTLFYKAGKGNNKPGLATGWPWPSPRPVVTTMAVVYPTVQPWQAPFVLLFLVLEQRVPRVARGESHGPWWPCFQFKSVKRCLGYVPFHFIPAILSG